MKTKAARLSGFSIPEDRFKIQVLAGDPDPAAIRRFLFQKDSVGLLLKGYLTADDSAVIARNFNQADHLRSRRKNVPASKIGADQFDKSLSDYLDEVEATGDAVQQLFHGTADLGLKARTDIGRWIGGKTVVRLAQHGGRKAGSMRGIQWQAAGTHQLNLHSDEPQTRQPSQNGFEIQDTFGPVAFNLYPVAERGCGAFRAYNFQPDDDTLRRLGIEFTAHPFPAELLTGVQCIEIGIESGDALIFNGRFLHGVLAPERPAARRLLLNFFFAAKRDGSAVICWT